MCVHKHTHVCEWSGLFTYGEELPVVTDHSTPHTPHTAALAAAATYGGCVWGCVCSFHSLRSLHSGGGGS